MEIRQWDQVLYLGTLAVKELNDEEKVKADTWSRENPDGYQRDPTASRVNAFSRYISKAKGASPLSVLLSVRSTAKFTRTNGTFGTLEIPDSQTIWIVDGQHRIAGFRQLAQADPTIDEYRVPVVVMHSSRAGSRFPELEARYEEAKQFVIVNRTQKGVRSDLGERFLARLKKHEDPGVVEQLPSSVTRGIDWIPKAIDIAEFLNKNSEVWKDRIRLPNEPKGITLVSQKSFTDSLRPILTDRQFDAYSPEELGQLIGRYWTAMSRCCREAFASPAAYVIQRTTGVFVLHRLFADVAGIAGKDGERLTADAFEKVLKGVKPGFTSGFWNSRGEAGFAGTGSKSFAMLSGRVLDAIRKVRVGDKEHQAKPFAM